MSNEMAYERTGRALRRNSLLAHGVTGRRARTVYRVQVEAIPMPEWVTKRARRGLSKSEEHVWLNRGDAKFLARLDRAAGGHPTMIEAEYRVCPVCKTVKLGEDATARRLLDEAYSGRSKPCDDRCLERIRLRPERATR